MEEYDMQTEAQPETPAKLTLFSLAKQVRDLEDRINQIAGGGEQDWLLQGQVEDIKAKLVDLDRRITALEYGDFKPQGIRKIVAFTKTVVKQQSGGGGHIVNP